MLVQRRRYPKEVYILSCSAVGAGVGVPLMAAGGGAGAITVWNLETRRLHTVVRDAHDAPLLSLHFFPGEPRLMSSAGDNSLKQVRPWRKGSFRVMMPDAVGSQWGLIACRGSRVITPLHAVLQLCIA